MFSVQYYMVCVRNERNCLLSCGCRSFVLRIFTRSRRLCIAFNTFVCASRAIGVKIEYFTITRFFRFVNQANDCARTHLKNPPLGRSACSHLIYFLYSSTPKFVQWDKTIILFNTERCKRLHWCKINIRKVQKVHKKKTLFIRSHRPQTHTFSMNSLNARTRLWNVYVITDHMQTSINHSVCFCTISTAVTIDQTTPVVSRN